MSRFKSLINFRDLVQRLAKNNIDKQEPNGNVHEAGIVISEIIKNSSEVVDLFTTNLDNSLYENSEFLISLENYLEKGTSRFNLFYDSNEDLSYCFQLSKILNSYPNQVKLKLTKKQVFNEGMPISFMIGDSTFSRIETDTKNHTAIFNFGDAAVVNTIRNKIIPEL
jgi:hypothetical protein